MKRAVSKHRAFLAAFARTGSITAAAKAAKMDRGEHYEWLEHKPGYREDFEKAKEQAAQLLEDEAVRRAHEGVFEPNTYRGEFVFPVKVTKKPVMDPITGTQARNPETGEAIWREVRTRGKKPLGVMRYSDSLLMFLLRGMRPERYRERIAAEVSGPSGGPIEIVERLAAARKRLKNGDGNPG